MAAISQVLAMAMQHHQAGRLQAAEQIYRQILAIQPDHADAWHLLGLIAHQVGKHEIAVEQMGRAIALNGREAAFHHNLGGAYCALRKIPAAVACYRRALELTPDDAEAHYSLGNALKDQGNLDEAVACYRRAVQLKPDYAEAHNNLGVVLKDQGKLEEAIACYRRVVQLRPNDMEPHNNLGAAFADQGKLEEAIACYRRTLELKPDFAEAHNNLGNVLKDRGKPDEALACYRRALELTPGFAEAHNNLGVAMKDRGKLDEALAYYRRALELKPDLAEAHNNLGSILEEIGDLRGAEDSFRAALRHNSRFALAHHNLAALLRGKLPQEHLAAQRRLLEQRALTDAERLLLHFGLAQVLDARGEYAEAARNLDRANSLQQSECRKCGQEYDPKKHEALVSRLIGICTPDFFGRVRGFGLESEIPVFVVGLPRSGTSLIEQILASHSRIFGAGETKMARDAMTALRGQGVDSVEGLRRLDRQTARRLASQYLEKLCALDRQALRVVDKMPENYLHLGLLASLFPRARFIHCRRDLRDVAVSCWMVHFREIPWASDQENIALRFGEHQRLMEHWRKVLPVPLLEVDYEETVADLEGVARKLLSWCGLAWEPACLEFHRTQRPVRTASAVQVRQPVFATSVGRWKHYQQELGGLFARLEKADARNRVGG